MDDTNRELPERDAQNTSNGPLPAVTRKKSKWAVGLLSFLFPGLGHLYAGAMQRGLFFMLLLAGNIFGVVLVSLEGIVPLIVLLSVMIPVVYFYSLFDALQTTEKVNASREEAYRAVGGQTSGSERQPHKARSIDGGQGGLVLIGLGGLLFIAVEQPKWLEEIWEGSGALVGAVILTVVGVIIYLSGSRKNR
jgi:hypothetical protein